MDRCAEVRFFYTKPDSFTFKGLPGILLIPFTFHC